MKEYPLAFKIAFEIVPKNFSSLPVNVDQEANLLSLFFNFCLTEDSFAEPSNPSFLSSK